MSYHVSLWLPIGMVDEKDDGWIKPHTRFFEREADVDIPPAAGQVYGDVRNDWEFEIEKVVVDLKTGKIKVRLQLEDWQNIGPIEVEEELDALRASGWHEYTPLPEPLAGPVE